MYVLLDLDDNFRGTNCSFKLTTTQQFHQHPFYFLPASIHAPTLRKCYDRKFHRDVDAFAEPRQFDDAD